MTRVVLTEGMLLATTGAAQPFGEAQSPRATGIEVANRPGARAILHSGMMGATGSMSPLRFEVDCLEGFCTLFGDLGGEVTLYRGQHSVVGGNGWPSEPDAARYELFTALADFVATPTATTIASTTPTNTRTPRPTRTPRNTSTPAGATATRPRVAGPAATMTPTLLATTMPTRPSGNPPTPLPNETDTPRPPLPTATTEPYMPYPTATTEPYVPWPTDTPHSYVPPTDVPWPTETPSSYPYP